MKDLRDLKDVVQTLFCPTLPCPALPCLWRKGSARALETHRSSYVGLYPQTALH